jgi:hypothetical protein
MWWMGLVGAVALVGCHAKPVHYLGDPDLKYYRESATEISYPRDSSAPAEVALVTEAPRRLRDYEKDPIRKMSLAEAIHMTLSNSKILKTQGQFLRPGPTTLADSASVQDRAIAETGVLFGQRGVEAALADFDANFSSSMLWGSNETVQNNLFESGGIPAGGVLSEETGTFRSQLLKLNALGGQAAVSHNWDYSLNNVPSRLFGSVYTGQVQAAYRQPLLAGSGLDFNRTAGPNNRNLNGVSGVAQGVVIARINSDISGANFEASVRDMLKDVETLYWNLSLAYRTYHAETVARKSALSAWRTANANRGAKRPGGSAAEVALAKFGYYDNEGRAENALADLYEAETRLRWMLGLPVNDGFVIQPSDEPTVAEFLPDWHSSLLEALTKRVELRQRKWNIKSLELQLQAARSLTRPNLDFVSEYRVNAFGNHLISQEDKDGVTRQGYNSAYESLTQGNQTGWTIGFEASLPIGLRSPRTQVRNLEHQLARERDLLAEQELTISHELSVAFQQLDRAYVSAQTNLTRRTAALKQVKSLAALRAANAPSAGSARSLLDQLLRAQASLAQAETDYFRSVTAYNQAITDIHYRKGTLLEHNSVTLAEDDWDPEAYDDALRRAWSRSHALNNPFLHTEPVEFVANPNNQDFPSDEYSPDHLTNEPLTPADYGVGHYGPDHNESDQYEPAPPPDGEPQRDPLDLPDPDQPGPSEPAPPPTEVARKQDARNGFSADEDVRAAQVRAADARGEDDRGAATGTIGDDAGNDDAGNGETSNDITIDTPTGGNPTEASNGGSWRATGSANTRNQRTRTSGSPKTASPKTASRTTSSPGGPTLKVPPPQTTPQPTQARPSETHRNRAARPKRLRYQPQLFNLTPDSNATNSSRTNSNTGHSSPANSPAAHPAALPAIITPTPDGPHLNQQIIKTQSHETPSPKTATNPQPRWTPSAQQRLKKQQRQKQRLDQELNFNEQSLFE